MALLTGMKLFPSGGQPDNTEQLQPQESFLEYLRRKIAQYTQNPVNVDQNFQPKVNAVPGRKLSRPQETGIWPTIRDKALMYPEDRDRIANIINPPNLAGVNPQFMTGNFMQPQGKATRMFTGPDSWYKMKTSQQTQPSPEMMGPPPPPVPQPGPEMGQAPPPMIPQGSPPQEAQPGQQMQFQMPQQQGPMTFQDYWKSMQEMQPKREKTWMDSPMYPFSMAMMGLGQNLMTPPRFRGFNQNTFAPMMQALAMQGQRKQEGDNRALFEKAVASYPHFVQATRPMKNDMRYILDAQGNIKGAVPGDTTVLPKADKETLFYGPGQGGANQFYNLGSNRNVVVSPEAKQKEMPPQVVPILNDDGQLRFEPVPQGVKPTSPMRHQPSLMQQFQQNQGKGAAPQGGRMVVLDTGERITEAEAIRRGLKWRR